MGMYIYIMCAACISSHRTKTVFGFHCFSFEIWLELEGLIVKIEILDWIRKIGTVLISMKFENFHSNF